MSISLTKNQGVSLTKEANGALGRISLGVGWDVAKPKGFFAKLTGSSGSIDLDASCIAFDSNGRLVDLVWFRNLTGASGSIRHSGDNLTGEGDGDDESIAVNLNGLPSSIETLILTVNSFTGQNFNEVENAYGRVVDEDSGRELARFNISDSGAYTGMILASLKRDGGQWTFKAIGEKTNGRTAVDLETEAARFAR